MFGTGLSAEKALKSIKSISDIIAYADNNYNKHGTEYKGVKIINPNELKTLDFDYVIIAIIKYKEVCEQLIKIGIDTSKIIAYFDTNSVYKKDFDTIFNVGVFIKDNYDLKIQKMNAKLDNLPYEINGDKNAPIIKNIEETIRILIDSDISISRYGDGELKLILGRNLGFQKQDTKLADRLRQILKSDLSNHIVGVLNVFGDLSVYTEDATEYFRDYLQYCPREFQYSLMDRDKIYYDAFITRPYICYKDHTNAQKIFDMIKMIWNNKNIVIVEGDRSRLGCGNDLFNNAKSCKRIICPAENAYDKYDDILYETKKQKKDCVFLIALGPTATVLAYDLAQEGYKAIDIGHIDIEYEWFRMGATQKVVVSNKYTNEAHGGNASIEYKDEKYESEIIARIS